MAPWDGCGNDVTIAQIDRMIAILRHCCGRRTASLFDRWLIQRCQQRQCYPFKAREGFGEVRLEAPVDERKQIAGVLRLDLQVTTRLPERAREHRQRGGCEIRELAAEFLLVGR